MKSLKLAVFSLLVYSGICFAGGSIGGGGGSISESVLDLANSDFNIDALPKTFVEPSDFRRAKLRLSVEGVRSTTMVLNGEIIDVRSLRGSVVDANISKELLPSPAQ